MKIAVTSQNRRDITEHAGRCRNFWVYDVDDGIILDSTLVELPKESSYHDSSPHAPHPLDGVEVLIAGGMGEGLRTRLAHRGIEALVTTERDPERAVKAWLAGCLPLGATHAHSHGVDHVHDDGHSCACGEGCGCH
ncbi:MAG: NifB/NifX family molybdenum-iron cluster-binding protein [Steroidobacteraceae bacterium]